MRPRVYVYGMRVALSQFLCMQHTCDMDVLCVQHARSVYAQYVQQGSRYQHTSNISVSVYKTSVVQLKALIVSG